MERLDEQADARGALSHYSASAQASALLGGVSWSNDIAEAAAPVLQAQQTQQQQQQAYSVFKKSPHMRKVATQHKVRGYARCCRSCCLSDAIVGV
jgi:hypothetical protein